MHDKINKREIGSKYENVAKKYLEKNGYILVEQNFFSRIGEIDIIANNDGYLCFIEVKYRDKESIACGLYAVDKKKQRAIYKVAKYYMLKNKIKENTPCRFDVISIDGDEITLIKNAFP